MKQIKTQIAHLLHQLAQLEPTFSSKILLVIFASSMTSSAGYGVWVAFRKLVSWINERREYQKLRYYYVLKAGSKSGSKSSDRSGQLSRQQTLNSATIRQNKSLLRSISLVGFNKLEEGTNLNFKTVYIKQHERIKKLFIKKTDTSTLVKNNLLFKNFKRLATSDGIFNFRFINKLLIIWNNILIPNVFNKNAGWLTSQVVFLVVRTYLSVLITKIDSQIVKNIIHRNFKGFLLDMVYWFAIAFPASYVNSGIKFFEKRLALSFRTNLVRYVHDIYMNDQMVFYKINGLNESIENIDQFISSDITKFCDCVTSLISSLGKPIIDVIIFSAFLRDSLGNAGIVALFANFAIGAVYLKRHTPDFGGLTKSLQKLEGEYFNYHANLVSNSEEISFYGGLNVEKLKVSTIFNRLLAHINTMNVSKLNYSMLENYILKIVWNCSGYMFAAFPVLVEGLAGKTSSTNLGQFIANKRLIFSLADSTSRLIYSVKDISLLSGYTDRVFGLLSMLHRCNSLDFNYYDQHANDIKGTIQNDFNGIRVERISVIIPSKDGSNGVKLVSKLSFSIREGDNLLILGFNGSGKTSIERIIAGLWPLYRGLVSKPSVDDIVYLPQVPYFLKNGTFRDQIIYPMTEMEFYEEGYVDGDLKQVLSLVKLEYLLERGANYMNSIHDWNSVLSGGEKQRLSLARVLFKAPKFVVLDESTNAISTDIEDYLYDLLQEREITYITLSHRPLLMKYHDHLIQIVNKEGDWKSETLGTTLAIKNIENEISAMERMLESEKQLMERKKEIDALLG